MKASTAIVAGWRHPGAQSGGNLKETARDIDRVFAQSPPLHPIACPGAAVIPNDGASREPVAE
jgi:hypothetical protein